MGVVWHACIEEIRKFPGDVLRLKGSCPWNGTEGIIELACLVGEALEDEVGSEYLEASVLVGMHKNHIQLKGAQVIPEVVASILEEGSHRLGAGPLHLHQAIALFCEATLVDLNCQQRAAMANLCNSKCLDIFLGTTAQKEMQGLEFEMRA